MKKMKKIVAILLALAMLSGFAVTGVASEATFSLTSSQSGKGFPAGTVIPISGNAGSGVSGDVVEIYENGNLITAVDSISNGKFSFNYKLKEGETTLTAKVYNGDNLVAQSEPFKVKGYCQDVVTPYWDVDFESHNLNLNGGVSASVTNSDGSTHYDLANKRTTLTVNVATTTNKASVASRADGKGRAIKLEAYDTGEVQCNDFRTELTDEIVRIDFDYMIDELTENGLTKFVVLHPVLYNGSNVWAVSLRGEYKDGKIKIFGTAGSVEVKKDTWYKISAITNRTKGIVEYFVDDVYAGYGEFSPTGVTKNFKLCSNIRNSNSDTNGSIIWIDNLKVSGVTIKDLVDVSVPDAKYSHPEGTVVKVYANAQKLSDTATSLKLVRAADGFVISEATGINATFDAVAGKWTQSYKVAAFSANGECIATSDAFDINGYGGTTNVVWDEDFTGVNSSMTADSPVVAFERNGVEVVSGGNKIIGNIGYKYSDSGENVNTIEVCDSSEITGKDNGDAICVTKNDTTSTACQLNEIQCNIRTGVAFISLDVAFSTLRYTQLIGYRCTDGSWVQIYGTSKGEITVGKDGPIIGKYEVNKWNNYKFVIDGTAGTVDIYIDDVYCYRRSSVYPQRFSITSNNYMGKIWVDNFVAKQIIKETPNLEINKTEYFVDGQATQSITDGNLTVTSTITNNTNENNVILLSGVYDSNKLVSVKVEKINFADGDTAYTTAFDMGEVKSGNKVKTMLWTENFAPIDVK